MATPSDVSQTTSDVNMAATSDVNMATPNDVSQTTSDVNMDPSDVSQATSDVNMATSDVNMATSDVNMASSDVSQAEPEPSAYVRLVSEDGHDFYIERSLAEMSQELVNMMSLPNQSTCDSILMNELPSKTVSAVCQYLIYKQKYGDYKLECDDYQRRCEDYKRQCESKKIKCEIQESDFYKFTMPDFPKPDNPTDAINLLNAAIFVKC